MNYRLNDYELLYMVRENDDSSQNLLYEKYLPVIKALAKDFYGKYNAYGYDYDDFVQEGLIAFQRAISNYSEAKNVLFYTFAVLCIKRRMLTFCRNISRGRNNFFTSNLISIEECDNVCLDLKSDIDSISSEIEIGEIVEKILWELPFSSSCIFELRFNGFTYREIGVLLEEAISTVEFRSRSAKKYFERALKDYWLTLEKTV